MKKLFVALGLVMGGLHVSYAEPASAQQVPGYYKHQFGNYRITSLLDGTIYLDPKLFKNLSQAEKTKILTKYAAVNEKGVQTSVNAFLVDDGKSLTLVDSGASSCFGPQLGSIAKNLELAGYQLANVKTVLLTHLHPDHVCGIAQNGKAVFPNATIYTHEREADYWLNPASEKTVPADKKENYLGTVKNIKAALAPYQAKKAFKTFKDGDVIQGFEVINTQGHTPGHHSFRLKSKGQQIVFVGDIVHSHSLQFDAPKTGVDFDVNSEQAINTRLKMFAEISNKQQWVAAPHLPFPGIGHVYKVNAEQYQWIPLYFNNSLDK
ncbi:MBL fold metallo-hydrolase [Acinetobacter nosocomialis]|uniref:MBL fold metallo-hydrolase n=1 Tax=Acinetobacter nosocomialis TaxID=106654 RepID=UPI0003B2AEE4|nr:MBL fold metallo-hydrolase [Acinetobacter nosocomialis]MDH2634555.1 MBL fold metallo-hydrolase [Acinetobacter nosocomialis]OTT90163.1 MBL fold metallo-hydrolase [Acinetobacter nosocomialis]QCP64824.1 MBL fold metallo-hydrolase [Acinetobacter nosocomialis M2]